ncbi:winged helix DNA-binding domain-containing protein [Nonomuraea lactucae]|uniref:winged helix DNA-binding domain-containing protein n=1 Tax=Nonomuraea lactucae TaxID=2249762 RepID=UPI000DE1C84C|nr:winged helix DNA-binding domain-containing protein [Nonomuraea lactucae]
MRSVEAQLLHRPSGLGAGDIVRHLLAVQAQDVTAARLAFRARSATVTVADVEAAWQAREIVRTWGPRGTLHFVHVDDLPWVHALTRRDTGILRRLAEEGVTGDDLLPLIDRALAGQGPLTKPELEERLAGRARGQGVVHLVGLAAFHGRAVLAPSRAGKPTYVHAADWFGAPVAPEPDRERALGELALRYRRAHRPSTPEDLAAWSGLPLGQARTAWRLSAATPRDDASAAGASPGRLVRLAPAFDEYLLGWKSRDPVLPAEHARRVFPGGGILRPVVLVDGRVGGIWSRKGSAVTVSAFGELPPGPLADEIEDVRRFLSR